MQFEVISVDRPAECLVDPTKVWHRLMLLGPVRFEVISVDAFRVFLRSCIYPAVELMQFCWVQGGSEI